MRFDAYRGMYYNHQLDAPNAWRLPMDLAVVDEAHYVYARPELRGPLAPHTSAAKQLLLLSDASQSLGAHIE